MAQPRPKPPLDTLQSMINAILIEVGRALRASDKEDTKSLSNANTRLKSFIPVAIDKFHEALDDLEYDIVRAKAAFSRDRDELQARRLALENPPAPAAKETQTQAHAEPLQEDTIMENSEPEFPQATGEDQALPVVMETRITDQPAEPTDGADDTKEKTVQDMQGLQDSSPPSSDNKRPSAIGLGIDTSGATDEAAATTAGLPESSIDSLFDIPDSAADEGDLNFDGIDFLDTSNTQDQIEFDLSTFGNSQEFGMPEPANDGTSTNTKDENSLNFLSNTSTDKDAGNKEENIYNLGNTPGEGDLMNADNLDLGAIAGDESVFDDIFFGDGNNDRGEMEHGDYDNAFFGLD